MMRVHNFTLWLLSGFLILIPFFVDAQIPDDFYTSGFPVSTGTFEKGVRGIEDIEFYHSTNYYDTPYDIRAVFPFEKVPKSKITGITVNRKAIEKFVVFNNHVYSKFKNAKGKDDLVIACQSQWEYDETYTVTVRGMTDKSEAFELSVSSRSPSKHVEFRLPDKKFPSHYLLVELDEEEINPSEIKKVIVNTLPVKQFNVDGNTLQLPLSWRARARYDIVLKHKGNDFVIKALAPRIQMSFGYPGSRFHFYHLSYTFLKEKITPFVLKKVTINGDEVRDFTITGIEDPTIPMPGYQRKYAQYGKKVTGDTDVSLLVRCNWQQGKRVVLKVEGVDEKGNAITLSAEGVPTNKWGNWNTDWKYYATLILEENHGIRRVQEPVHLKIALYSDRLTDPEKEIRVVEYDRYQTTSPQGPFREIPSQVYHVYNWHDKELVNKVEKDESSGERIIRYLPTTTLELAFFADVYPYSEKVYLVFYGNPKAKKPNYPTDLVVSGPEIGQTVENNRMKIDLADTSGAIFGVFLKQGKDVLLEHKLETNGAVHWNPGAYSPPHAWVHASDWKTVQFEQVSGPIFHMTKRWAPLPHMDNVLVTITYVFYAGKPYMISSSLTEVKEEFYGKALRNGEIVFNHEALNEFAYKSLMGEIKAFPIETSLKHPEHAVDIPYNVPWVAFINSDKKIGFGAIALELANTNRFGGLSDAEQPYYYVANGPWIYFSRALNYSFGSNNTSRMIHSAKGSMYYEKTAFMPLTLGETQSDKFETLEKTNAVLRHPLHVSYHLDTDNRNNTGWVIPVLVEPFDEGVEGAVGKKEKEAKK